MVTFSSADFFTAIDAIELPSTKNLISSVIRDIDYKLDLYMDRTDAPSFYDGHAYYGDFIFVPMWRDELDALINFLRDYFGISDQDNQSAENILELLLTQYARAHFPHLSKFRVVIDWSYVRANLEIMFDTNEVLYYQLENC